jgi:nucleoside-diphosphate-sugar epimerase
MITGASGFFGRNLISELANSTLDFCALCTINQQSFSITDERFRFEKCDLFDVKRTRDLIETFKPTHLIHLAWYVVPGDFWNSNENFKWLQVSLDLFKLFCENGGNVFIGAGTLSEYDWAGGVLNEAKTPVNPSSVYGKCKASLHKTIRQMKSDCGYKTAIIWPRIGYFFGEYEPKEKLISKIIYYVKNGLTLDLATRKFARPYAHVKYLSKAFVKMIQCCNADMIFNMSSSFLHDLETIINFIKNCLHIDQANVNYGAFDVQPEVLHVTNDVLKDKIGMEIPDTIFEDIRSVI